MLKTFPIGGIHPSDSKISRDCPIETMPLPETVTIPLSQHIGAPAEAVVTKGERVRTGQLIGRSTGFVSSNIHSSVTGTVTAVDSYLDPAGLRRPGVTIKTEPDEWMEGIDTSDRIIRECTLSPQEIVAKVGGCGSRRHGGATFPTQVKLSVPDGRKAEFLIINGVECEPYLTDDYRVMLERGEELLTGIRILARALGAERVMVGIENNKPEAIGSLRQLAAVSAPEVEVVPLKVQYPQGSEKHLIAALTGREVPSGGLPIDVGAIVQNVGTALAVYDAVQKNKPLIERVVTVTGPFARPPGQSEGSDWNGCFGVAGLLWWSACRYGQSDCRRPHDGQGHGAPRCSGGERNVGRSGVARKRIAAHAGAVMYPLWQVRERVSDGTGALSALQTFTESGLGRSRGTPCDRLHRVWFVFLEMSFGTAPAGLYPARQKRR